MKIQQLNDCLAEVNQALSDFLPEQDDPMREVMAYSLANGGKRVRPFLTLAFCELCGGKRETALPFAAAVEYVHTYSLIHDDLPCMDDDDMRRGQPSSHIRFGEANALLGGDALLTRAFGILVSAELPPSLLVRAVDALSLYAGTEGMIGGQVLDLAGEGQKQTVSDLKKTDAGKTAALIKCACVLGCIAADASWEQIEAAENFADNLGIAFQIQDDILDVTSDSATLGKPVGSDVKNEKSTYVSLLGLDGARKEEQRYTENALRSLDIFGQEADVLRRFASGLSNRLS